MASPQDPFASQAPTKSTDPFAEATIEKPKKRVKKKAGIDELKKKAEKVKSDPNEKAAQAIRRLKGDAETVKQLEGLTALNQALISVLTKLAKEDVDISKIRTTKQFKLAVTTSAIKLSLPEATAVENLDRIAGKPGPTATEIKNSWPDRIKTAQEASKGITDKYVEYWKKHPGATAALTIAGAAGVYLTYQAISTLVKRSFAGEEKGKDKETSWFKKEIMIPLVIMAAGAFLGKDTVKKILADCGLDYFKLEEKIKKGEELTKEDRQKLKKGSKKLKERLEAERKKKGTATPAPAAAVEKPVPAVPGALEAEGEEKKRQEAEAKAKEAGKEVLEEAKESAKYEQPRNLLVQAYCYDHFEYDVHEVTQIKRAIDYFKDKEVGEILSLWSAYEGKGSIPRKNKLAEFEEHFDEKNIYTAVMIIGKSAKEYKKRFPKVAIDSISLKTFFEKHIYNDSVNRVNVAVQEALTSTIFQAEISNFTSLSKITDLNLDGVQGELEKLGSGYVEKMASDLDINLEGVNKIHLASIVSWLTRNPISLNESTSSAFKEIKKEKYSKKTLQAAKEFFEKTKKRTLKVIIPAAINRFNIKKAQESANANILKDSLNANILFKKAIHLNLVTQSIDLEKDAKAGSSAQQELAFLFTVLSSIPEEEKRRYVSELMVLMLLAPSDIPLPSLALIQPIFEKVGKYAVKKVKSDLKGLAYMLSAIAPNRTPQEEQAFLEKMRNASWYEFGTKGLLLEVPAGTIQIGREFITPFIDSGKVTLEQLSECESGWDFMMLVIEAGGTFIYGKDEEGRPRGMVNFLGKYYVFKPAGLIKDTFDSALEGDPVGSFKLYTAGTVPFVTLGAARGYWQSRKLAQGWLAWTRMKGAALGAAKGYAYPYYALRATGKAARRGVQAVVNVHQAAAEYGGRPIRAVRQGARRARDIAKYRTLGQNVGNLLDNARRFEAYKKASGLTKIADWDDLWHFLKNDRAALIKRLAGNFNEAMAIRYMDRTTKRLNRFYGFKPSDAYRLKYMSEKGFSIDTVSQAIQRFEGFIKNVGASDDVLESMLKASRKLEHGEVLSGAMRAELKKLEYLTNAELDALARQLQNPRDVEKLVGRLRDGVRQGKAAPKVVKAKSAASLIDRLKQRVRRSSTPTKGAETTARGARRLRNAERIRDAVRQGYMTAEEAAAMGVKVEATTKISPGITRGVEAAESADDMLRAMEHSLDAMETARKGGGTKVRIYEAVSRVTGKALEALSVIGTARKVDRLRILEVLKIANNQAKVLEVDAKVLKLFTAVEKARESGKTAKAARKGKKLAEATKKAAKARKTAEATKEAVKVSRRGFLTAEEATRFGLKVEQVAAKGGKIMKFVRVAGRVFIVVDAIISVYDVYDQACELGRVLSVEYVETGSIRKAMDRISKHGESMVSSARAKEEKENQSIINSKNLQKKLSGSREIALRLYTHASQYGITRRRVSGDDTFDQLWSGAGSLLSEITLTPTAMRLIYGSNETKLRESERKTIEMNVRQANTLIGQLEKISPPSAETEAAISALKASIDIAKLAVKEDEIPPQVRIRSAKNRIDRARGYGKKARYIELLAKMASMIKPFGNQEQLISRLNNLEETLKKTDYPNLDALDKKVLKPYNELVQSVNEIMLQDDIVITKKNESYIVNAYIATHLPKLENLKKQKELWKGYKKDPVFIEHCRGIAEATVKSGMTVREFDAFMKQNFSEQFDDHGNFILMEKNMIAPEGLTMAIKNGYPTLENYLWDPKTMGYILGLCNRAKNHPALGSSAGAYISEITKMLNDKAWQNSTPDSAKKGGEAFFNWIKKSLKKRDLETPEKYFGYSE